MTAVMVPVTAGSGGGGNSLAKNNRGRATVPPGAEVTLVSFTAGSHRLRGFHVTGEGDAFVWMEVGGIPLDGLAARHTVVKEAYRILPNPEVYASAIDTVTLRVQNQSSVTCEFEGIVFGE